VLILDVARFKYPPHWVSLEALFEAMQPHDPSTAAPRGYLLLSAAAARPAALLTLSRRRACCGAERDAWLRFMSDTGGALAAALSAPQPGSQDALGAAVGRLLAAVDAMPAFEMVLELYGAAKCGAAQAAREAVLSGVRSSPLWAALVTAGMAEDRAVLFALLLMASGPEAREGAAEEVRQALEARGAEVSAEVAHLRSQLLALRDIGSSA